MVPREGLQYTTTNAIIKLDGTVDNLEQYGRSNCLILRGLRNLPNVHNNYYNFVEYIVDTINHHLNMNLTPQDVDIAHPLRKAANGKTPVVIKFVKKSDRNAIYQKNKTVFFILARTHRNFNQKKIKFA